MIETGFATNADACHLCVSSFCFVSVLALLRSLVDPLMKAPWKKLSVCFWCTLHRTARHGRVRSVGKFVLVIHVSVGALDLGLVIVMIESGFRPELSLYFACFFCFT